jgi:hypothetical protein
MPPLPGRIIPVGRAYGLVRRFGSVDEWAIGGDAYRQFEEGPYGWLEGYEEGGC